MKEIVITKEYSNSFDIYSSLKSFWLRKKRQVNEDNGRFECIFAVNRIIKYDTKKDNQSEDFSDKS